MKELLQNLWLNDEGQDIAEYALMLAVIAVVVLGAITAIGTNANTIFQQIANAL
jgi:pilus assembly protein Flp/PilA